MKINSFTNVIPFSGGVRTKRNDGEGGSARQQYDPNQTRQDKNGSQDDGHDRRESREREEPFDPKLIDDAIESFKTDAEAQVQGLSATVEGRGPGLKISLKDCNGTTLRQFSGEEFLRLREVTTQATGKRGKILDQKL